MDKNKIYKTFLNKSVLITGGTGSLGNELIKIFFKNFKLKRLAIFSRDELKQSEMIKKYSKLDNRRILRFLLGDVRDSLRVKFALRNIDFVIHAAALKHVDMAEYNPMEYVNTNIVGGKNTNAWFHVTVREGRNRIIRRMWKNIGYDVSRLIRIGYGPIELPRTLSVGKYKKLTEKQIEALYFVLLKLFLNENKAIYTSTEEIQTTFRFYFSN